MTRIGNDGWCYCRASPATLLYSPTMAYEHRWLEGSRVGVQAGKAVCVGRNYAAHARELNNPVPTSPLLFMKPSTSFRDMELPIQIPSGRGECQHEVEIALLVSKPLCRAEPSGVLSAVAGYGLALDLTLRTEQRRLKDKGHPWELAKAFDGSCPLSRFVPTAEARLSELSISLKVNGVVRQSGAVAEMLTAPAQLVSFISQHFTLLPGDVVLTGTPAGVAALEAGDVLSLSLDSTVETHPGRNELTVETQVAVA